MRLLQAVGPIFCMTCAFGAATIPTAVDAADVGQDRVVVVEVRSAPSTATMMAQVARSIERAIASLPELARMQSRSSNATTKVWMQFAGAGNPADDARVVEQRLASVRTGWPGAVSGTTVRWQHGSLVDGSGPPQPGEFVRITVDYPGAVPEVVENEVTGPIENALNALPGVGRIRSNSWRGRSTTYIDLAHEIEASATATAIDEAVAQASRNFPKDAGAPSIVRERAAVR
jgi:multidrug efflux pump subunit AcrB